MKIVGRYNRQEIDLFPQMFAHLVEELERHAEFPEDILGRIFHELELHNKYKGQFFSPQSVCDMMGMIALSENDADISKKGFVTVCEPCSGSGAMILGFAKAMQKNKLDFHQQMVVTATDVDIKCVWMCYLQLSLYGIPAVVIHGNTISVQEWSRWYTPVYMLDGWVWRQSCGNIDKQYSEDEAFKRAAEPMYAALQDAIALTDSVIDSRESVATEAETVNESTDFDINLREAAHGQIAFDL